MLIPKDNQIQMGHVEFRDTQQSATTGYPEDAYSNGYSALQKRVKELEERVLRLENCVQSMVNEKTIY